MVRALRANGVSTGGRVHGVILAGAHVWDDMTLDAFCPRPLLPVMGEPLIGYAIRWLRAAGVGHVTVCANHRAGVFRQVLGDGSRYGVRLDYYEDRSPRGPAGCVRDVIGRLNSEHAMVVEGSILPSIHAADFARAHQCSGAALTLAAHRSDCGGLSPCGIYACSRAVLDRIPLTGYQDIKESMIPRLNEAEERVSVFPAPGAELRVRGLDSFLHLHARLLERMEAREDKAVGFDRHGATWIHQSAKVAASARVVGPAVIGPDVVIESGALVLGPCVIGRGCRLGRDSMVANSVLWESGVIESRARLTGSFVMHDGRVFADTENSNTVVLSDPDLGIPIARRELLRWSAAAALTGSDSPRPIRPSARKRFGPGRVLASRDA